jgi:hypothetical protein
LPVHAGSFVATEISQEKPRLARKLPSRAAKGVRSGGRTTTKNVGQIRSDRGTGINPGGQQRLALLTSQP